MKNCSEASELQASCFYPSTTKHLVHPYGSVHRSLCIVFIVRDALLVSPCSRHCGEIEMPHPPMPLQYCVSTLANKGDQIAAPNHDSTALGNDDSF